MVCPRPDGLTTAVRHTARSTDPALDSKMFSTKEKRSWNPGSAGRLTAMGGVRHRQSPRDRTDHDAQGRRLGRAPGEGNQAMPLPCPDNETCYGTPSSRPGRTGKRARPPVPGAAAAGGRRWRQRHVSATSTSAPTSRRPSVQLPAPAAVAIPPRIAALAPRRPAPPAPPPAPTGTNPPPRPPAPIPAGSWPARTRPGTR